jgi:hypothetical protein
MSQAGVEWNDSFNQCPSEKSWLNPTHSDPDWKRLKNFSNGRGPRPSSHISGEHQRPQVTSIISITTPLCSIPLAGRDVRAAEITRGEVCGGDRNGDRNGHVLIEWKIWMFDWEKSSGVDAPSNKSSFFGPPAFRGFLGIRGCAPGFPFFLVPPCCLRGARVLGVPPASPTTLQGFSRHRAPTPAAGSNRLNPSPIFAIRVLRFNWTIDSR